MASSVHGMAFSNREFLLVENKASAGGGGCMWQDPHDEAGLADFFDEFVVLDGVDSSASSTAAPPERGGLRAITPPATTQQRQMRGAPADVHRLDMVDMRGLPPNYHDGPGKGSISDSELLKLEGLKMRSPRVQMGPMSSSVPPSPTRGSSPRKTGRFETLYAKARDKMATMHAKVRPQQPQISTAKMEPVKRPRPSKAQFPISPPLTDSIPDVLPHGSMPDDFASSAALQANTLAMADIFGPDLTPLHTPLTNGLPNGTTPSDHPSFWPFSDPNSFTSSTDSFWGDPAMSTTTTDTMDIDDSNFFTTSYTHINPNFLRQHPPPPPSGLMIHMPEPRGPSSAVLPPSHHIAITQPSQPQFHYPPPPPPPPPMPRRTGPDISPSRRPKPRRTGPDISPSRRPKPRAPSSGARHHHVYSASGTGPSPRKPSSSNSIPPSPSPGPSPGLHRRSASMQMLRSVSSSSSDPHHPHSLPNSHPMSASALRKRKSWTTSRRVSGGDSNPQSLPHPHPIHSSPRKGLSSRRSSSNLRTHHPPHPQSHLHSDTPPLSTSHNTTSTPPPLAPQGQPGGFVNFTPQDHHVLMRGVAPSGSSKTKARRDKEAAEQKRKLEVAVRAAVQAAGGDLSKLRLNDEGFELGVGMGLLAGDGGFKMEGGGGGGGNGDREGGGNGGVKTKGGNDGEGRRKGRAGRRVSLGREGEGGSKVPGGCRV